MADQSLGTSFKQQGSILFDHKGSDLAACKNGFVQMLIQAEEFVPHIKNQLVIEESKINLLLDLKLLF